MGVRSPLPPRGSQGSNSGRQVAGAYNSQVRIASSIMSLKLGTGSCYVAQADLEFAGWCNKCIFKVWLSVFPQLLNTRNLKELAERRRWGCEMAQWVKVLGAQAW